MIKFFKRWLEKRHLRVWNSGYDWCAGMLLRGYTFDEIEAFIIHPWDYGNSDFDMGAAQALKDWKLWRQGAQEESAVKIGH